MVGILVSFSDGPFSGAMLDFGGVFPTVFAARFEPWKQTGFENAHFTVFQTLPVQFFQMVDT